MSNSLTMRYKSVKALVALLQNTSDPTATAIKSYFQPYCDCDITIWLIEQINNNNMQVINKIRELISTEDATPINRNLVNPGNGFLLRTYCQGPNLIGMYANGDGTSNELVIKEYSNLCWCAPFQIDYFDWTLLPDTTTPNWKEFYNNPLDDGVCLNLNLGGYYKSWTDAHITPELIASLGPQSGYYANGVVLRTLRSDNELLVDGPATYDLNGQKLINLDRYNNYSYETTESFVLNNSIVLSRYEQLPTNGEPDKYMYLIGYDSARPTPGHHVYQGVATYRENSLVQALNYGKPILFEMWYSLNEDRSTPDKGYNNYTFISGSSSTVIVYPDQFYIAQNNIFVRKFTTGIYKVGADLTNIQEEDCIAACIYTGTINGGEMKIVINGLVHASRTINVPAKKIGVQKMHGYNDRSAIDYGINKTELEHLRIWHNDWTNDGTNDIEFRTALDPEDAKGIFLDTFQIKSGFYLDMDFGGIDPGPTSMITHQPHLLSTLPNPQLNCIPTEVYPDYVPAPPVMT